MAGKYDEHIYFINEQYDATHTNPLNTTAHIYQYFSDWLNDLQVQSTGNNSWRAIQLNSTTILGSDTTTGPLKFGNSNDHNVIFSYTSGQLYADVGSNVFVDLLNNQTIDGQKDFNTVPRVRIDGEHPREGLPTDLYTQLQYVESNGSQYIDTTYAINTATDTVEIVFECIGTTIYKWLFGEHDNNARFGLGVGDGTNRRNVAYGTTTYKVNDTLFYNQLHHFKADSTGVFIDDTKIANYSGFSSTSSLALFCLNNNGFVNGTAAKIQSYKHTRNNVALIDIVSVKRNSDNKAGFYDFVSENFISSATSNDLSAGPELPGPHYEALITDANFAPVAFSGSYTDLINQPTIPIVNNGTLTIQKNGTTITTFTANQSASNTANITVPTKTTDLTNDSGFITNTTANITESQVINLTSDLQNIREVAEGKTASFVTNLTLTPALNSQAYEVLLNSITLLDGSVISISDMKIGDNVYVNNLDVPDRWIAGIIQPPIQYAESGDMSIASNWGFGTITNNVLHWEPQFRYNAVTYSYIKFIPEHIYLICIDYKTQSNTSDAISVSLSSSTYGTFGTAVSCPKSTTWTTAWNIHKITRSSEGNEAIQFMNLQYEEGYSIDFKNFMVIDLTETFGAGNEPTTLTAFKSYFPNDYYAYNITTGSYQAVLSILETVKPNIASISVNGVNVPPVNENVDITVSNQTIKAKNNGTNVTFGSNDVVEIVAGSNVSISANAAAKTITINATGGGGGGSTSVRVNDVTYSPDASGIVTLPNYPIIEDLTSL